MLPSYSSDDFYTPIWPKRRLNMICGSSGAGKTRYILPQLHALHLGQPINGEPTVPTPVAYICCDRTVDDAKGTMKALDLDPDLLPCFSFMDNDLEWDFKHIVDWLPIGTKLTFIEAIGALVPNGDLINYHNVLKLGRLIHKTRRTTGSDFMGSTHTPKTKKGEDYKHTRDSVLGSSAWPGIAGTIVVIEETEQDSSEREIHILTRDDSAVTLHYEFNQNGHLVERSSAGVCILDLWLKQIAPGTTIYTAMILDKAKLANIPQRTAYRWVDQKVTDGELLKIAKGQYEVRLRN